MVDKLAQSELLVVPVDWHVASHLAHYLLQLPFGLLDLLDLIDALDSLNNLI